MIEGVTRISENEWEVPVGYVPGMRVPGRFFLSGPLAQILEPGLSSSWLMLPPCPASLKIRSPCRTSTGDTGSRSAALLHSRSTRASSPRAAWVHPRLACRRGVLFRPGPFSQSPEKQLILPDRQVVGDVAAHVFVREKKDRPFLRQHVIENLPYIGGCEDVPPFLAQKAFRSALELT